MNSLDDIIKLYNTLEKSQQALLANAERLMGDSSGYSCDYGICRKSPEVDKTAWHEAIINDPNLFAFQAHFDKAEKLLKEAQQPYMKERFYIK